MEDFEKKLEEVKERLKELKKLKDEIEKIREKKEFLKENTFQSTNLRFYLAEISMIEMRVKRMEKLLKDIVLVLESLLDLMYVKKEGESVLKSDANQKDDKKLILSFKNP